MIFSAIEWGGWGQHGFHSHIRRNMTQFDEHFLVLNYLKDPLKLTAFVQGYVHGLWTDHHNSINNAWFFWCSLSNARMYAELTGVHWCSNSLHDDQG